MKIIPTDIEGAYVLDPDCHYDSRGFFSEIYQAGFLEEMGIREIFLQDNHSHSHKNVLRGLHFNIKKPQAQLLTVIQGEIFDVVVDLRRNSPVSENGLLKFYLIRDLVKCLCQKDLRTDFAFYLKQLTCITK